MIRETTIQSASSGFGEWTCGEYSQPINEEEFFSTLSDQGIEWLELGRDELRDDVADIRGRIHHQPTRVLVLRHPSGDITYLGISED